MDNSNKTEIKVNPKRKIKPWVIAVIAFICVILGVGGYFLYKKYSTSEPLITVAKKTSNKVVNNLDGTKADPTLATRHPLAIMVENHPDARPQSGLDKASIVYEAITEGGITRFMAVYGPTDASKVGPVRSARTYYIDWVQEFKAFYGHVGGNLDALDKITSDGVLDLNQFSVGDKAYWREPRAGIAIEHTMFTSTDKLYAVAKSNNWPVTTSDYTALKFTTPQDAAQRGNGQKISINFSAPQYSVSWSYDKTNNNYLRTMAGVAHKDAISGEQLKAFNVIIQKVTRTQGTTAIGEDSWTMQTTGEGSAIIFSQGKRIDGTWKKTDENSRTIFYDNNGKEISFVPGKFWIEITPPEVFSTIKVEDLPASTP